MPWVPTAAQRSYDAAMSSAPPARTPKLTYEICRAVLEATKHGPAPLSVAVSIVTERLRVKHDAAFENAIRLATDRDWLRVALLADAPVVMITPEGVARVKQLQGKRRIRKSPFANG